MKLRQALKKIKDWFFPVGTLTSKLKYSIDFDYDIWVEKSDKRSGNSITLWWSIDKPNWKFNCGERPVVSKYFFDSCLNDLYSFSFTFASVDEAEKFIEDHPRLIDLYRTYVCSGILKPRREYKKALALQKREKAKAKNFGLL